MPRLLLAFLLLAGAGRPAAAGPPQDMLARAGCANGACTVPAAFVVRSAPQPLLPYAPVAPAYAPAAPTYAYPGQGIGLAPSRYIQPNPPAIVSTPAPPPKYEMSDGHGGVWMHGNPEYLKAWIAGRKSALDSAAARVVGQ